MVLSGLLCIISILRSRCGTDMRLLVPGGDDALHYAKPRLQSLFARMHLLPDRAAGVSLKCEVRGICAGHGSERVSLKCGGIGQM